VDLAWIADVRDRSPVASTENFIATTNAYAVEAMALENNEEQDDEEEEKESSKE
jgi:hypothetical protein